MSTPDPARYTDRTIRDDPTVAIAWQRVQEAFTAYEQAVTDARRRSGRPCPECGGTGIAR